MRPPAAASAALAASSLSGRGDSSDVVSMLIGIYGGPLLFMEEYRLMLADRLLAKDEYDCVREIRTLELLKIRSGGFFDDSRWGVKGRGDSVDWLGGLCV